MNTFDNVTVTGKITQNSAATGDSDLARLGEVKALLAALFQGAWAIGTSYTAGQMASDDGAAMLLENRLFDGKGFHPFDSDKVLSPEGALLWSEDRRIWHRVS